MGVAPSVASHHESAWNFVPFCTLKPGWPHAHCECLPACAGTDIKQSHEFGVFILLLGRTDARQALRLLRQPRQRPHRAYRCDCKALYACALWSDVVLCARTESVASNYILLELTRWQRLEDALNGDGGNFGGGRGAAVTTAAWCARALLGGICGCSHSRWSPAGRHRWPAVPCSQ